MKDHPKKNVITRALLPHQDDPVRACIAHTADIASGDYFFLCSDGMLEEMSDNELIALLASSKNDEEICQALRETTTDNQDNHSAHLIHIDEILYEEGDEDLPNDEATVRFNAVNLEKESRLAEQATVESSLPHNIQLPLHIKQIAWHKLLSSTIVKDILLILLGFILAVLLMKL